MRPELLLSFVTAAFLTGCIFGGGGSIGPDAGSGGDPDATADAATDRGSQMPDSEASDTAQGEDACVCPAVAPAPICEGNAIVFPVVCECLGAVETPIPCGPDERCEDGACILDGGGPGCDCGMETSCVEGVASTQTFICTPMGCTEAGHSRVPCADIDFCLDGRCAPTGTIGEWSVDPRGSYLRVPPMGNAIAPLVLELEGAGIEPGSTYRFSTWGRWSSGANERANLVAVFSSSNGLGPPDATGRVFDAIDVLGVPEVDTTSAAGEDVAEDFAVTGQGPVTVTIPAGARYLFVGVTDSSYGDNRALDGGFGLSVSPAF